MGLGRVFKKIGDGFLTVGKIIADVADIPFAEELIAFVPVVGPALSIAMKYVDEAEKKFSEPKSGKVKMAWALHNTRSALLKSASKRSGYLVSWSWLSYSLRARLCLENLNE